MRDLFRVEPQFFDRAAECRRYFDALMGNPYSNEINREVWDYWYVPEHYTYLRTSPERVFPKELCDAFVRRLSDWALETLGTPRVTKPSLSLYVAGCGQTIHNDSENGRWGYVYSLTHLDRARFLGGETVIFREKSYWETPQTTVAGAHQSQDLIPPRFNQLLVFDDRALHGVRPLQGNMDPREGRLVMHGHLRDAGVVSKGGLDPNRVLDVLEGSHPALMRALAPYAEHHGLLSLRLFVAADGTVREVRVLSDRVVALGSKTSPEDVAPLVCGLMKTLKFPPAPSETAVTVPLPFGDGRLQRGFFKLSEFALIDELDLEGPLTPVDALGVLAEAYPAFMEKLAGLKSRYEGVVYVRVSVSPEGRVQRVDPLPPRASRAGVAPPSEEILRTVVAVAFALRFPPAAAPTALTVPVPLEGL